MKRTAVFWKYCSLVVNGTTQVADRIVGIWRSLFGTAHFSRCICIAVIVATCFLAGRSVAAPVVIVVVGAEGEAEYGSHFHEWAEHWRKASTKAGSEFYLVGEGDDSETNDHGQLQKRIADCERGGSEPLWLVLIGHGTFDGRAAKFNLRGNDLSAEQLAEWLKPISRTLVVINCASASAPFVNRLAGQNRVVITATQSSEEQNFARFGEYLSVAIADSRADIDKDDQVSLLEAYLTACRNVDEYYKQEARLATEHAILDDNGDGLGTPAAWFRGLRAIQRAKEGAALDGARARQIHLVSSDREKLLPPEARKRRNELELAIAKLRDEKRQINEDEYYKKLEPLMMELARLYERRGE